jgi:hypothetical protein
MKLDRKDFLRQALVMAGAGFGLTRLTGCGGDESVKDGPGGRGTGGAGAVAGTGGGSVAGASGTGGSSVASGGGAPGTGGAGTGGSSAASGGRASETGGSSAASGGRASGTGGSSAASGGRAASNGGTSGGTGGGSTSSGGSATGGSAAAGGKSGTGGTTGTTNACAMHDPANTIGTNHPLGMEHILVVPPADAAAGIAKTYDIRGNSTHTHSVTISMMQFSILRTGIPIMSTTTFFDHTHVVTVVCA